MGDISSVVVALLKSIAGTCVCVCVRVYVCVCVYLCVCEFVY